MAYSDFMELAKARYSVRKFLDKKVPKEIVEKIIEAGMIAPTGCNNQPQRVIVVESQEGLAKIFNEMPFEEDRSPCGYFADND